MSYRALVLTLLIPACGNDQVHHLADAPPATIDATRADGASTVDAPAPDAAVPASITSFTAPASACDGATVTLAYTFAGGSGVIEPGHHVVASGTGTLDVMLAGPTTYTLTVTGGVGAPATATADVGALPAPDGTLTGLLTARQGETATLAVPSVNTHTYAWTASANASITGGATTNQITYTVSPTAPAGATVTLTATITSANGCTTVASRALPLHCTPPTLISVDPATAMPVYGPNNLSTRPAARNAAGDVWAPSLVYNPTANGFDVRLARYVAATSTWGVPASTPATIDTPGARIYDVKIATDAAGDAVVAWTQTTDFSTYTAKARAYVKSTDTWTAVIDVGADAIDQATPIFVVMNQATGVATIVWEGGPFNNPIPHLRTYAIATGTLGPDTPVRATVANAIGPDLMGLDVRANAAGDGLVAWFEKNPTSGDYALYALHLTGGAPDATIQTIVTGSQTYVTDLLNQYSVLGTSPADPFGMVGVSDHGAGAIVWHTYNGSAPTGTAPATFYARRYTGGTWGPIETIATSAGVDWHFFDVGVDDAGDVFVASLGGPYQLLVGLVGQAWQALVLNAASHFIQPYVAVDGVTGRAFVTWYESNGARGVVRGAIWDPVAHVLSPGFTLDDPTQKTSEAARPLIDATGAVTIVYLQTPAVPPVGANSNVLDLEYAVTCH